MKKKLAKVASVFVGLLALNLFALAAYIIQMEYAPESLRAFTGAEAGVSKVLEPRQAAAISFAKSGTVTKKATKSDYDETIRSLKKGQGYALVELKGFNGKLLAVADKVYDDPDYGICALSVTIYGKLDGKVTKLGETLPTGTSSPIAVIDGELYICKPRNCLTYSVASNGKELVQKDYGDHFSKYKKAKKLNFTKVK
ncbi:hypothetical protein D6856_10935 [Butyrivibrio sp. XB500-5]|uniref:hypothetical protein n=1 Tax=Butyrivibrio sp. XB500-5 TaxID=2364880 RepID=UPI000EA84E33|nr:hypothetical protein [Butyrivibrio sp. XB500-5]RKM59720.1 hypothetical protein D6856_10935 [Butyrivibrio sp. XB500-5]